MAKRSKTAAKAKAKATQLRKQIEDTFEKTLERTVERAMAIPQVERATKEAMRATREVKETLDQALLDLQHKAVDLKSQPQDLIQKVGQRVLERAERIRSQVAETPYSPSWLKDLSLVPRNVSAEAGEMEESLEDSAEEKAAGVVVETKKAKVKVAAPGKKKAKSAKKSSTEATESVH